MFLLGATFEVTYPTPDMNAARIAALVLIGVAVPAAACYYRNFDAGVVTQQSFVLGMHAGRYIGLAWTNVFVCTIVALAVLLKLAIDIERVGSASSPPTRV